jgi:phosphate transport system permease protein
MFGATPRAQDLSRYPIIILPIVLVLAAYGILMYRLIESGVPNIDWDIMTTSYIWHSWTETAWHNDWPVMISFSVQQVGISQFILGTFLLMFMTSIISLPVGIAVGVYVTEYSNGRAASVIRFATNSLRAISVFILGLLALSIVRFSSNTFFSPIFCGFFTRESGEVSAGSGSFITASIIISLLVIPVIANATEQGIRSLPRELTEGSLAVGASHTYTIGHILLPWALPNIVTGLLIGCAEAAGSLATIMFISGTSQYGIGPFSQPTSLSVFIYRCWVDNDTAFRANEGPYMYAAAILLLLITLGLSITAIFLRRRFLKEGRAA